MIPHTLFAIFKNPSLGASHFCLGQVVGKSLGFCPVLLWYATFADSILVIWTLLIINASFDWMINKITYHTCLRLNCYIYSLPAHELLSLSLPRSLISFLDWFALNSYSFSSLATSSNSIVKYPPCTIDILSSSLNSLCATDGHDRPLLN